MEVLRNLGRDMIPDECKCSLDVFGMVNVKNLTQRWKTMREIIRKAPENDEHIKTGHVSRLMPLGHCVKSICQT